MAHPDLSQLDEKQMEEVLAQTKTRQKRRLVFGALLVILLLLGPLAYLLVPNILHHREIAQLQEKHDASIAKMSNLERVHAELIPNWAIAQSNRAPHQAQAFEALQTALAQSPKLIQILQQLAKITQSDASLQKHAQEIVPLIKAWNMAMDQAQKPWWMEANVLSNSRGMVFYIKTYKILADFRVPVDGQLHRVRIVGRADRTNVVESLLGHTSPHQEGAIILADRILDFTVRSIWPILNQDSQSDGLIAQLNYDVSQALPPKLFHVLNQTSLARAQIEEVLRTVGARHECGSKFMIRAPSWRGFSPKTIDRLEKYMERDRLDDCPSITDKEIQALKEAQETLDAQDNLKEAVESLGALVAQAIVVHEVQHAQDDKVAQIFTQNLPCEACDELRLGRSSRAELSSYLASLATSGSNHIALYQMCQIKEQGGPHGRASTIIMDKLQYECGQSDPVRDLVPQAQKLQHAFFARQDTITLSPATLPKTLELYERP